MMGVKWAVQNKPNMLNYISGKIWDLEIFKKKKKKKKKRNRKKKKKRWV